MTQDLIQKLMISKKIMDKHKQMPRGQVSESPVTNNQSPILEEFGSVKASYNIPEEYSSPVTKTTQIPKKENSKEKILGSKLPDNIKRLMMEHPISVPAQSTGPVLSDDLVEKASRLMNNEKIYEQQKEQKRPSNLKQDNSDLKFLIRETMEEILRENGLISEESQKTNDVFSFRVGNHIFEGKVTKIKKVK